MLQTADPPLSIIHGLDWQALSPQVQQQVRLALLDTLGIAAGGLSTRLSGIIRDHATAMFGGPRQMLFDGRAVSPAGLALAAGMTIDSLDGHDGYNPAKGHVAAPMIPAALAMAPHGGADGRDFLTALVLGYELGCRTAVAQHGTVPDYHTSGSWGAVAAAAAGARLMHLTQDQTRHALGIAEYHGPRSQMMRCIDYPTMLKDGAGWGAMTGTSAVFLAQSGFTGAPAITVEQAPEYWSDLGQRWLILEQYFKPYPVCRWAQAPIEGVLALARKHNLTSDQVERIEIETFHESVRLATSRPHNTEEAQYSTSFPCAVALVRGGVKPQDIADDALEDPEILRLSASLVMKESDRANASFPKLREARTTLVLKNGQFLQGDYMNPRWTHTEPPSEDELRQKFHELADPVLGLARANAIETAIEALPDTPLSALSDHLFQPIS
jgi:2-methylcitrate dehydratase PrpD